MKIIKKSEAVSFTNSPACAGSAYAFEDNDIDIALVTVDGRYPEKGYVMNEVCKEVAYIVSGTGSIHKADEKFQELNPGDAVFIKPGEKFYWQGTKLEMVMPCSPAFYPEQHKEVA